MSKRVIEFFLIDTLIAIDKIKRYTQDFENAQDFLHDEKSFDATMRELEILGEAAKHLLQNQLLSKEWQIVVDFRNIIIHEYFGIDIDEVWEVITLHLGQFEKEIFKLLKNMDKQTIQNVLSSAIEDYKYSAKTVKFIRSIQC